MSNLTEIRNRICDLIDDADSAKGNIHSHKWDADSIRDELDDLYADLDSDEDAVDDIKRTLDDILDELDKYLNGNQGDDLTDDIDDDTALLKANEIIAEQSNEIDNLRHELEVLKAENEKLTDANTKLAEENLGLRHENEELIDSELTEEEVRIVKDALELTLQIEHDNRDWIFSDIADLAKQQDVAGLQRSVGELTKSNDTIAKLQGIYSRISSLY